MSQDLVSLLLLLPLCDISSSFSFSRVACLFVCCCCLALMVDVFMVSHLADDSEVPVQLKDATDDMYTLQYHPTAHGHHTIDITWAGEHILKR